MNPRKVNPRKFAGLLVLAVVILIVTCVRVWPSPDPDPAPTPPPSTTALAAITVNGLIGGKEAFFKDPDIIKILTERYGITVTYRRLGSPAMVKECAVGYDFCWPSNQNSGQEIKDKLGSVVLNEKIIFHTPIVFYSWGPVADALIAQGVVERRGDIYYIADFPKLIVMMLSGTQWSDIAVTPKIFGDVYVLTSDPESSTTGNSYVGLLANALNCGKVVDQATDAMVIPLLQSLFEDRLLAPNNTVLWENYLNKGMGDSPVIAGIESTILEYSLANQSSQAVQNYIRDKLITLYPEPTVLTSQPLIALTEGGLRLMEALRDSEIQLLGWEHHGFRPAVTTVFINPTVINIPGIRTTNVDLVIPMPLPAVMNEIVTALKATPAAITPASGQMPTVTIPSCLSPPVASPVAGGP